MKYRASENIMVHSHWAGPEAGMGLGTGPGSMGSYILDYAEMLTLVQDRERDQDSIVPVPFAVPVPLPMPCNVNKPLHRTLRVVRLLTDEAVRLLRIHRVEVALVPHVLRRLPATLLPPQPLLDDVAPVLPAPGLPVLGIPLWVRYQVPPPTAQHNLENRRGRKIQNQLGKSDKKFRRQDTSKVF